MAIDHSSPKRLDILDTFVIATTATIVVIRAFLIVAGFPRLGGDAYHIAHVLWGGLLLGLALLLSLLTPINRLLVTLVGGIGFGFFIDEIGKFVTTDNNYFYQGSFVLIYLIVLAVWLGARVAISRHERQPLFFEAAWPSKTWESYLLMTWGLIQAALLPIVAIRIAPDGYALIEIGQLLFLTAFTLLLTIGLSFAYLKHLDKAAAMLRLAAFTLILTILPFLYYLSPEFAIIETIGAVMVIVGLSEVSIGQLLRYLWPFK